MTDRLSPQRETEIRERWSGVPSGERIGLRVTDSSRPGTVLNALLSAPEDVPALLAELAAVRAERDALVKRDITSPLAVIAKHGDMSETVRREIRNLLADAEAAS